MRWYPGRLAALALFLLALAACGPAQPAASEQPGGEIVPVLAVSELVTGPNRLALGLLQSGTPLNEPDLSLGMRLFYLDGADPEAARSSGSVVYRGEGLPFGLYVGYADFAEPGAWRLELSIPREDGSTQVANIRLDVLAESRVPAVGDEAIPSASLTAADAALAEITSDPEPDPGLYQLSVADAIAAGRPFMVSFSTPGYCQTAVCAPNMLVIKQLAEAYAGQVNFVHVEVYPYPFGESFQAGRRVAAMDEWGLRTEPWTFLVDGAGVIQARYEGGITFAELEPAMAALAAGRPVGPPAP